MNSVLPGFFAAKDGVKPAPSTNLDTIALRQETSDTQLAEFYREFEDDIVALTKDSRENPYFWGDYNLSNNFGVERIRTALGPDAARGFGHCIKIGFYYAWMARLEEPSMRMPPQLTKVKIEEQVRLFTQEATRLTLDYIDAQDMNPDFVKGFTLAQRVLDVVPSRERFDQLSTYFPHLPTEALPGLL